MQPARPSTPRGWPQALAKEIWHRPLVLLALLFAVGLAIMRPDSLLHNLLWVIAIFIGAILIAARAPRPRAVIALAACIFPLVFFQALWQSRRPQLDDFLDRALVLQGTINREPVPSKGNIKTYLDIESLHYRAEDFPVSGSVRLYLPLSVSVSHLERIQAEGVLRQSQVRGRPAGHYFVVGDHRLFKRLGRRQLGPVKKAGLAVRAGVLRVFDPILPGGYRELHAGLLGSLFFGSHGMALPEGLEDLFRRTGTMHVLVVSGTQISLLFMVVYFPGLFAHWRRRRAILANLRALDNLPAGASARLVVRGTPRLLPSFGVILLGLMLMCLYALLTQGGKPVARAAVMAGLVGGSMLLSHLPAVADRHGLDIDRYNLLAAAGLLILLIEPTALFSRGFQLSFAAVWGILFLAPRLRRLLPFWGDFWAYLVCAPIAAQLSTIPIIAWHFGTIPLVGLITNMVVVPVAALLLWLGLAAFVIGLVWSALAWPLGWVCDKLCWLMTRTLAAFDSLPAGIIEVGTFPWLFVLAYFIMLAAAGAALGFWLPECRRPAEPWKHAA